MEDKKDALILNLTPAEIKKIIEDNLTIKKDEKNKFGEVFTPSILINEMIDKLPREVWSNPSLKWLDPANGIGNFPMIVYERLLKELPIKYTDISGTDIYTDISGKKKWILEHMIYMVEINPKNVKISKKIFGENANISCGDFLMMDVKRETGIDMFDIIIGNPPWNDKKKGTQGGSRAKNSLWDKFIKKSLRILNENGYLGFINPSQWRGLGPGYRKIMDIIKIKQLIYLHIFGEKQSKIIFGVGSRFDLFILKNTQNTKSTEIIDELGNKNYIQLSEWDFLPNYGFGNIKKIITEENGINVIFSYSLYFAYEKGKKKDMSKIKTNIFKYPVVHSITKKDGIVCWYSKEIKEDKNGHSHFGEPKVLLNFGRHQYPVNDFEGKYGMSQITFGIPIKSKKEGDDIIKAINTEEFKEIIKATKWGAFQTDWRMFKYFKPDFYKYF